MKKIFLLAVLPLLISCATDKQATVEVQKQSVVVKDHCTPDIGPSPKYPDTDANLKAVPHPDAITRLIANPADVQALTDEMENLGASIKILLKGRLQRIQREGEILAAFAACK